MAQRYPADFDGIVSAVPVIHWTGLFNGFIGFTQPQFSGGTLSAAKVRLVADAVNTACDALDGLADGVVNNYLACPVPTHHDMLNTLDQWVSTGQAPADALVQVRKATAAPYATLATRPLCRYPNYPQYVAGDPLSADSYRCAVSAP
jgi:feruloyl esterase